MTIKGNYNFRYKLVDVPNWYNVAREVEKRIPEEMLTEHGVHYCNSHYLLPAPGLIPLIEFFSPLNNLFHFSIINLLPNRPIDDCPIHIDNIDFQVVLNIPIYNCENVKTKFYKFESGEEETRLVIEYDKKTNTKETNNYQLCPTHLMKEIDSFVLTQPTFINNSIPHTACNYTNDRRTVFNIRFKTPIDPKFYI